MKFLQVTDTHLMPSGERLKELDPESRMVPLFDDINQHHADAELAVITGDLADRGDSEAYEILERELRPLKIRFGSVQDLQAFGKAQSNLQHLRSWWYILWLCVSCNLPWCPFLR